LRLHRLCEEVVLDPFSEVEVAQYLESRLPESGIQGSIHSQAARSHRRTAALHRERHRRSRRTAKFAIDARAWSVPESLAGAIEKQIARSRPEAQRCSKQRAYCGVEFRATTLSAVWDRTAVDHATVRRLWRSVSTGCSTSRSWICRTARSMLDMHFVTRCIDTFSISAKASRRACRCIDASPPPRTRPRRGIAVDAAELASQHEAGLAHAAALRYYARARACSGHFAPREAIDLTSRALSLLDRVPEGLNGWSSNSHSSPCAPGLLAAIRTRLDEGDIAYRRALELCDILPLTPARAQVLGGLAWMYYSRADYDDSLTAVAAAGVLVAHA
jgi:hypothetical protein